MTKNLKVAPVAGGSKRVYAQEHGFGRVFEAQLPLGAGRFTTKHEVIFGNSCNLKQIGDKTINLIVTSPPYPMIEMWDDMFAQQDPSIKLDLLDGNAMSAFHKMHSILDQVWAECDRVLMDNGFVCINIGDATRTINGDFQLFTNHARIINAFQKMGYCILPDIHWRKQSNAPNKFMGSGMYPAGAYITYEHEYILIFRKGGKRIFKGQEKSLRQKSAFFWEERNIWFSDLWEIKGTSQKITSPKSVRSRNASYPLEIPYRLINMYSIEGDTVLDPFLGLGTTSIACMIAHRNSMGVEIDPEIMSLALENMDISIASANQYIEKRINKHLDFINGLPEEKRNKCYDNMPHGFKVKTRQETAIEIEQIASAEKLNNGCGYVCEYRRYELELTN